MRQVRNYLEESDASPILFHLLALQAPEEFWPIIDREIEARNFFLYCDSQSASASEPVQRERRVVAEVAKRRPIRIGHVRVDQPELDRAGLEFLLSENPRLPLVRVARPRSRAAIPRSTRCGRLPGFFGCRVDCWRPVGRPD